MPGAVNVTDAPTGTNDANQMNVNGNRIRDNNFYLDGGQNTSQWRNGGNMSPNPDAVAEFHLITSNFDAEYGRQPGSVLNVVTRRGTQRISRHASSSFCETIRSTPATSFTQREPSAALEPVRRHVRRTGSPRQDVLLRVLPGIPRGHQRARRMACWCRRWRSARAISRLGCGQAAHRSSEQQRGLPRRHHSRLAARSGGAEHHQDHDSAPQ